MTTPDPEPVWLCGAFFRAGGHDWRCERPHDHDGPHATEDD